MYVSEICAEGIFVAFPCWLKNVKSRSKIALFSNERHFAIWFPKKKTITFFWSKLSKLHKKDPILHVATTFSLKQGETRNGHGPIPHPLNMRIRWRKPTWVVGLSYLCSHYPHTNFDENRSLRSQWRAKVYLLMLTRNLHQYIHTHPSILKYTHTYTPTYTQTAWQMKTECSFQHSCYWLSL